jgi:hypothetical protein
MNKQEVMALFVDDVHLAPHEDWTISLPNYERKYGEISWYDDLYVERYEDFSLNRIDKDSRLFCPRDSFTGDPEKYRAFVTECMDNGYFSFTFDW